MGTFVSGKEYNVKMGFFERRRQEKIRRQWLLQQSYERDRVRYAMWLKSLEEKYYGTPTWQLEDVLVKHSYKVTLIPLAVFIVAAVIGGIIFSSLLMSEDRTFLLNVIIIGMSTFFCGCIPGVIVSGILERPSVSAWIDEVTGEWERRQEMMERCGRESCKGCLHMIPDPITEERC